MPMLTVPLSITADDYVRFYQGHAKKVTAIATNGQRVIFPAERLKPFVRRDGIQGCFQFHFDEQGKIQQITAIG